MYVILKSIIACTFWVLALTMMAFADFDSHTDLRAWAILLAVMGSTAAVLAGIDIVVAAERRHLVSLLARERVRTEELVTGVAEQFAERERHLRNVPYSDSP